MTTPLSFTTFAEASDYLSNRASKMDRHERLAHFNDTEATLVDLKKPEGDMLSVTKIWDSFYVIVRYQIVEGNLKASVLAKSGLWSTGNKPGAWIRGIFSDHALMTRFLGGQSPLQYFINCVVGYGWLDEVDGDLGHDHVRGPLARAEEDLLEAQCEVDREEREFDAYGDRDLCR
jgi:hypothetical protein